MRDWETLVRAHATKLLLRSSALVETLYGLAVAGVLGATLYGCLAPWTPSESALNRALQVALTRGADRPLDVLTPAGHKQNCSNAPEVTEMHVRRAVVGGA